MPLAPGLDPADAADSFGELLGRAESYVFYRVRIELDRAADRQEAFVRVREVLEGFEDSPERQDAMRLVADRLDLPPETQAGLAPRGAAAATGTVSAKVLEAGERLERDALAGCMAHPEVVPLLAELSPDTSTASCTVASRRISSSRASRRPSSCRCSPSSTPRRAGGDRRADGQGAPAPAARASHPPAAGSRIPRGPT